MAGFTLKEGDRVEFGSEPGAEYILQCLGTKYFVLTRVVGDTIHTRILSSEKLLLFEMDEAPWGYAEKEDIFGKEPCECLGYYGGTPEQRMAQSALRMTGIPFMEMMLIVGCPSVPLVIKSVNGKEMPQGSLEITPRAAYEFN